MHREIMHAPKGMVVDHRDNNGVSNCQGIRVYCGYTGDAPQFLFPTSGVPCGSLVWGESRGCLSLGVPCWRPRPEAAWSVCGGTPR